jgi:hypothetical protein
MLTRTLMRGTVFAAGLTACSQGLAGGPESVNVSVGSDADSLGYVPPARGHVKMTSNRDGHVPTPNDSFGLHDQRRDTFRVSGMVGYEDLVNVKLRGDFKDLWQPGEEEEEEEEEEDGDFAFIQAGDLWQENAVGDTKIILGSFDDRLSFTWRRAWSSYNASESYLKNLEDDAEEDDARLFAGDEQVYGSASSYSADAVVWDGEYTNLAVLAQQSEVDPSFQSVALSEDAEPGGLTTSKDLFATPGRETFRIGTTLGLGPMEVTLLRDTVRIPDEEASDESHQVRQGISASVDLNDLRRRSGEAFQGPIWAWAPDSVWIDVSNGRVESPDPGDPPDAADDISFGVSWWSWDSAYADASFWRSGYDSRGISVDDYDWAGDGADVSFGLWGANWNVDSYFGLYRSEYGGPSELSTDESLEGGLWLTFRPEVLPDVSGGLYVGRYGYDYLAYDGFNRLAYNEAFRTDVWELGVDLDLSKSLVDWKTTVQPTLKMTYRFGPAPAQAGSTQTSGETGHTLGVLLELKL